jgi:ABC-type polysaccharide/polyol phosphate transport system ATPase subunit
MSAAPGIELSEVGLVYRLYSNKRPSLKASLVSTLRGGVDEYRDLHALRGVSFRVAAGERIGIVGRNGAGKTTLLRLLAGIFPPTTGSVRVDGFVVPLFRLGLGFEPELTGEENLIQAGALLDIPAETMRARADAVFDFAEIGRFRHTPLKYYSRGMATRLSFATACEVNPEVLLLDEVFGGGDMSFREKAVRRMQELILRTPIVVMVSHSMDTVLDVTNRVLWLDEGVVRMDGAPGEVIAAYEAACA